MKTALLFLFVLLARGMVSAALSTLATNELDAARAQAADSLITFRTLVRPTNYHLLGFHSADEVQTATNAEPLLVYEAVHDKLRIYVPGQNLETLLEPKPRRVLIPVMAGPDVRSSIMLRSQPGAGGALLTWAPASWGQSRMVRELTDTYRSIPAAEINAGKASFAVEIPAIDVWLLGYYNPHGGLMLRATAEMRLGPMVVHRHEILTPPAMHQLAIVVQRYNGLPN
jgi:hypothetical protein